jgi:hypothetical protein
MAAKSKQNLSSVLAMLVLNNQAHIHYELCEYSESCRCMAQVTSILTTTPGLGCCILTLKKALAELHFNTMLSPTAAHAA